MQSEFLASDHSEERGADLFGQSGNHRSGRGRPIEDYVEEDRVVAAPILSKPMVDARDLRVPGEKLLEPLDPLSDFILLNQS
jgi:hypothetical protein